MEYRGRFGVDLCPGLSRRRGGAAAAVTRGAGEVLETGAVATGGTVVPSTTPFRRIPKATSMLLAITPTSATNRLKIEVVGIFSPNVPNWITAALFQETTVNALACMTNYQGVAGGAVYLNFTHWMVAGTTSATTFKVRAGRDASAGTTITFNGVGALRRFGGALASGITITELLP